ncbi:MAG: response regulator [Candidatus Omnitrophota bacterium]
MEKLKIMTVDDELNFTDLLKQYFEPRNYGIDIASNGDEALRLLDQNKYDVVLMDLKMVGLDGDEIMREIKTKKMDTRIIFITAYADSGRTKKRLLAEGAYAFVEKPIKSLKHLETIVNEAVKKEKRKED